MTLKIEYIEASKLIPYVNNSRTHSDQQVQQVAASIKEFGFTNPILIDEDNGIIAGHGRLIAAQKLGLETVPTITLSGLSEAQRKAYVIADNQLALNADWDIDALKVEVDRLTELDFNLNLLGFDDDTLQNLTDTFEPNFDPATEEEQGQLDELDPKWVDCPHCGKEFDMRGQA
jgi:ParB family chromosome partitioning protein